MQAHNVTHRELHPKPGRKQEIQQNTPTLWQGVLSANSGLAHRVAEDRRDMKGLRDVLATQEPKPLEAHSSGCNKESCKCRGGCHSLLRSLAKK